MWILLSKVTGCDVCVCGVRRVQTKQQWQEFDMLEQAESGQV